MLKKSISRVFVIISLIAILQITGTIVLARNLTKSQMGLYRLILTIIELGSLVSLMGLDHAIVRFFSSPMGSFNNYNWKRFLKIFYGFSLTIVFFISIIAGLIYKFDPLVIFCIFICLALAGPIFLSSAMLRACKKYELSILFCRLNFLLFFLFLVFLFIFKRIHFTHVLAGYVLSAILASFIVMYYCNKYIPLGEKPVPVSIIKNGVYYFVMGVSLFTMLQASYLLIAKFLSLKDLAVYAVIASTMRIFEFVQDSSYHVLVPHLNAGNELSLKIMYQKILLIGILIATLYILFSQPVIHFLFKGLYDEGIYLVPIFVGIGLARTLFILPASIIGAKSSELALRNQVYFTLFAALANIYLTYVFIQRWQLRGAAYSSLITWLAVLAVSLILTKRFYRK